MTCVKKKRMDKKQMKDLAAHVAAEAFMCKGIRNVKMDDIASDLSMSKRTLYELFGDKEELLLEVVKIHREEMKEHMRKVAAEADNVLEIIMGFYIRTVRDFQKTSREFFEDIKKYPRVVTFLEDGRKDNIQGTLAFYRKGVEEGIFRDDVKFDIVQEMVHGQMNALMRSEISQRYSLVELFETVVFMHMRGISTEKGLKIVNDFLAHLKEGHEN